MAEHITLIGAKDDVTAVPPMNGETTWLRILYGHSADQIHIDRAAAKRLRDSITEVLAELDEIEQSGATKVQRGQAALNIINSRHLSAMPKRTQQKILNKLAKTVAASAM